MSDAFIFLFVFVFLSEQPSIKEDPSQQKKENPSKSSQRDAHQSHWTISHTVWEDRSQQWGRTVIDDESVSAHH